MRRLFVYGRFRQDKHIRSYKNNKNQIMIVKMLQNYSHKYSSHYSIIIKCINFEHIHYGINLNIISSFIFFNKFDYVFLSCINNFN